MRMGGVCEKRERGGGREEEGDSRREWRSRRRQDGAKKERDGKLHCIVSCVFTCS